MGSVRLSSLTLEGFKSFAGRVDLSFPGAIIAIVGPNGSGKSNISDAIAWVLGEQSARLLRSQNMADVIFAGAPSRQPLGAAEVTLTLGSADGRWPETEGKLTVSRRVMRDGTSDYRMQGRRVRLRDIMDELIDAGLGTRAYAIIEQGRIGQVLSVKATERRNLFEEAAGITKYRVRRHEAELKLAETSANLLRLADVAAEVRRALEQARRQARRAEKHRELRTGLAEVRAALFAGKRAVLLAAIDERQEALTAAGLAEAEAASTLAAADAALAALRRELDAAQERLAAARDQEAKSDALAQRREAEEAAARRENAEATARREAASAEAARLAAAALALEQQQTMVTAALAAAEDTRVAREREAGAAAVAADSADTAARGAGSRAEEARRDLLAAVAAASEAKNRVHRLEVELEQDGYQRTRLTAEHERLSTHLAQEAKGEEEAARKESEAAAAAASLERERQELRARQESLAARAADLTADRDRAGHERWQARHEREGLGRLLAEARALPTALARALPAEKILGTVADFLAPGPDVAKLLDTAYGDMLNTPVCADEESAALLAAQAPNVEGKLAVVVADRSVPQWPSPLLEQGGAAPENVGWLSAALPRAAVARDLQHARELAVTDPDLVVLLPGGGRRRGTFLELPGARAGMPGTLELRIREREVLAAEEAAAEREAKVVAELDQVQREIGEVGPRLAERDAAAQGAAEALAAASSARASLHRESQRLERELEALAAELARLAEEATALAGRLAVAREEVERLGRRASEMEAEVDALARDADRAREAAAAARAQAERARGAEAVALERVAAARRDVERHAEELADLRSREAAARDDVREQGERAEAAGRAAVTARVELEELLAHRSASHNEVERLTSDVEGMRARVEAAAGDADQRRSAHLAARDGAHAARLALTETNGARERLEETIALTLAGQAELPPAPPAEAVPELETREQALSAELEALGPVNELAVAERDELEQRHAFLKEQRRDLESSMESLNGTVQELDATCAERFLATLAEVNVAFDVVFKQLFGGGEARAELSDPEAPLESGIEIRVRPPGKHTQSVLLLSGGEKALAAVALLLALFRIRPAPFCLLDEVDAPLDDANVERLASLLREMSSGTQFLLITHNRRTMAHADVLYGVTMEEAGVSRIVSVRLEE
ncbi:MAG TPA: chromosome segregation protein SMC [Thermoanaerobaculaceae bacterium]|nr:chromosome segregation protein SMC [Thermoanaerobaculaceae bacterium]